jgi:chemotaxis protein histidine kinase CheA
LQTEERNDEGLKMKVGGYKSYFLNSKEGRKPLPEAVIRALLPTEKEAPKVAGAKKEAKKETAAAAPKKEDGPPAAGSTPAEEKAVAAAAAPKESPAEAAAPSPESKPRAAPVEDSAPPSTANNKEKEEEEEEPAKDTPPSVAGCYQRDSITKLKIDCHWFSYLSPLKCLVSSLTFFLHF